MYVEEEVEVEDEDEVGCGEVGVVDFEGEVVDFMYKSNFKTSLRVTAQYAVP